MDEAYPYSWSQDPLSFDLSVPTLPTPSPTPPPGAVAAVAAAISLPVPGHTHIAQNARPQSPYGASWCSSHAVAPAKAAETQEQHGELPQDNSRPWSTTRSCPASHFQEPNPVSLPDSLMKTEDYLNDGEEDTCEEATGSEIGDTPQSANMVENPVPLLDLSGTTAARSRKMDAGEREIMLMKRRLRNRASAARSRQKQRNQVNVLQDEVKALKRENERLLAENAALVEAAKIGRMLRQ